VSAICDKTGADVVKVAEGIGLDKRIGKSFLNAGIGFGGFCFPKDLAAFIRMSEKHGYDFGLLKEVVKINESQKRAVIEKMEDLLWNFKGKVVGVLGLSFKPDTDDIRFSPSIDVILLLQKNGVKVKAYDPHAMPESKKVLKKVEFCKNPYEVAKGSDCLLIATEWNEFKQLDFRRIKRSMRQPIIVDGRNVYDPEDIKKLGFKYTGIGRR
jgi:UDPglucose 6-dehydrogenase